MQKLGELYGIKPPKLIGKTAITGRLTPSTKTKVTKRINEILTNSSEIKIGVMGDTEVRMDGTDYRSDYDFVTRIFKTKSKEIARDFEVKLIKKFKKSHPKKVKNISEAKAGRLTTYNGFYYVYIVFNKE